MKIRALVLATSVLVLAGCGAEVGRVPFTAEGMGSVTIPLAAGDVDFWTDLGIEYPRDASLQYTIALEQGGAKVATAICDPLGRIHAKTRWTENNLGSSRSRNGNGKMACSVKLAAGGPTTVKATLGFASKPASVVLTRADLVVRQ